MVWLVQQSDYSKVNFCPSPLNSENRPWLSFCLFKIWNNVDVIRPRDVPLPPFPLLVMFALEIFIKICWVKGWMLSCFEWTNRAQGCQGYEVCTCSAYMKLCALSLASNQTKSTEVANTFLLCWVWQHTLLVLVLGRQRQADLRVFRASLVFAVRPCLRQKTSNNEKMLRAVEMVEVAYWPQDTYQVPHNCLLL